MKYAVKTTLAVVISSMLAACGGTKGSFGVEDVEVAKPEITKGSSKDVSTTPRVKAEDAEGIMRPALGYEVKIPRRSEYFDKENDKKIGSVSAIYDENLIIPHHKELEDESKIKNAAYLFYTHNSSGKQSEKSNARDLEYVRSGYIAYITSKISIEQEEKDGVTVKKGYRSGPVGYVYYKGIQPSKSIPKSTVATYKGTWDFVTDASSSRKPETVNQFNKLISNPSDSSGAPSFEDNVNQDVAKGEVGHTSEFTVDFGNKTLKGNLYKNLYDTSKGKVLRYSVDANIAGNRFKGKAIAKDKADELFGKDSNYLEGGFYGPNSEELAGKFLADDASLFAVFAAKRDKTEGEKVEKQYDAVSISLDNFTAKDLNTFGNIDKLMIDGKEYDLATNKEAFVSYKPNEKENIKLAICCSNLDYVKFGSFEVNKQASYFLQGERTATKEIPTAGEVKYKGTWDGYVSDSSVWSTSASNQNGGSRSEFDVDFRNKTISGKLTAENHIDPTFTIHGSLEGNGFSGKASTGKDGFNLDPAATNSSQIFHMKNVDVKGGFFGKDASELGGTFHSEASKVGVVFGAKRQANE